MIVNLRGTSGAGKSYIVRKVMSLYPSIERLYIGGRRQPIGYRCTAPGHRKLHVIGHYETPCGGCDTIQGMDFVFGLVREAAECDCDVLFEGLIVQDDHRRSATLYLDGYPMLVVVLEVPLEVCLASIQARREARGDSRPLNPANTTNRVRGILSAASKLKDSGVDVRRLSREAGLEACLEALGWPTA